MALKLGMQAKLYVKVGGVAAVGPWSELGNVKDVTLSLETGEADVTTRANAGWRATIHALACCQRVPFGFPLTHYHGPGFGPAQPTASHESLRTTAAPCFHRSQ